MKNRLFLILGLLTSVGFAQTLPAPENLNLIIEFSQPKSLFVDESDSLVDPMDAFSETDSVNIVLLFDIPDTVHTSKIHVKLDTVENGSNLLDTVFVVGDTALSDGLSYSRIQNAIRLGLGGFLFNDLFYAEIYLEDESGSFSEVATCNSNE